LNALIHILIHPVFLLWCLILAGIFFYFRSKFRTLRVVVIAFIFWLFIISISPIPIWMAAQLEDKYPAVNIEQIELKHPVRIMVLGAGHTNDPALPDIDKLYSGALARLAEGIRIYKMIEGSQLICSGYAGRSNISQAEVSAMAAIELGVNPSDTILLTKAHNTKAEAKAYADRFNTAGTLILVTDAIHMPRAMHWFHKHGINPIAAPTNHYIKRDPDRYDFPFKFSTNKIILMEKSLHEYVGMLAR
jgi:uncharacterized SAM-binding protein YcdF (DUF218 family)